MFNKKDLILFLIIIGSIFIIAKLAIYFSEFHLSAKFNTLTPLREDTKVILKGVEVGEVEKVYLTKDIKYTMVDIKLYKKYNLPVGTIAKLRKQLVESKTYIELEPPEKDTKLILKEHRTIPGKVSVHAQALIQKHLESGTIESMIGSAKDTMKNATNISANLNEATELAVEILSENKENISATIKNFTQTSENVKNFTAHLDEILADGVVSKEIKETLRELTKSMKNFEHITGETGFASSIDNVESSTQSLKKMMKNLEKSSKNIKDATGKLNKTMNKTHCILDEGIHTARSVQHLTNGMSKTMSKNFLFWRFMFGKPGHPLKNPPEKCK